MALEKNRIKNPNNKSLVEKLNTSTSKELTSIAELLHRSYEAYDRQQFKMICKVFMNSQYSQTNEMEMQGRAIS